LEVDWNKVEGCEDVLCVMCRWPYATVYSCGAIRGGLRAWQELGRDDDGDAGRMELIVLTAWPPTVKY
jgi:hypothetical protein